MPKRKQIKRTSTRRFNRTPKINVAKDAEINYKDATFLIKFVTDRGKLLSRRLSGVTAKQQRDVCLAVKRARYLGLLPVGSTKKK